MADEVDWTLLDSSGVFERFQSIFNNPSATFGKEAYFDKMTHFDFKCLLPALLQVEDRMSAWRTVWRAACPLLDHPLVEFAATIPADVKFKGGQMKHFIKSTFGDDLPQERDAAARQDGLPGAAEGMVLGRTAATSSQTSFARRAARHRAVLQRRRGPGQFRQGRRDSRARHGACSAWSSGISASTTARASIRNAALTSAAGIDAPNELRLRDLRVHEGFDTGGAGQVGSTGGRYAARARRQGPGDRQFRDRPARQSASHPNLTLVEDTIADGALIDRLFADFKPEWWSTRRPPTRIRTIGSTDALVNAVGTRQHRQGVQDAKVGRLIYFQTALCYGTKPLQQPIRLDHPINPVNSSYAISKTAGEHYVQFSGVDWVTFRLANVIGPRNVSGPLPIFFERLSQRARNAS